MNNLRVGTASEVSPVLQKHIYILLGKVSITVILAFSLETVLAVLDISGEVAALSRVTWLSSQLLFSYASTRSRTYSMITWLLFSSQMLFFAPLYTFFLQRSSEVKITSRAEGLWRMSLPKPRL